MKPRVPKSAVIWDMDGVLVDTGELHYTAWRQVLAEYGVILTPETFQTVFGMSNAGILAKTVGDRLDVATLAEIGERKERLFRSLATGRVCPLPGVQFWLEWCTRNGIAQAIASSAPLANIQMLVREMGIGSHFAALVSGADLPSKPSPAVFLAAAETLRVEPSRCVVVEDSPAGVEGAKRAGMKCVAVLTTSSASELCGVDLVVGDLESCSPAVLADLLGICPSTPGESTL